MRNRLRWLLAGSALALAGGCAWGAQGVYVFGSDGSKVCEAHVRFLVVGTGDTSQTSGACAPYGTTTKDTGFSDNAAIIIPGALESIVEGAVAGFGGGGLSAVGPAVGVLGGLLKPDAPPAAPEVGDMIVIDQPVMIVPQVEESAPMAP